MFYAGLILLFIGYKIVGKKLDIYFFDLAIILANKSTQGNISYGILSVFFFGLFQVKDLLLVSRTAVGSSHCTSDCQLLAYACRYDI